MLEAYERHAKRKLIATFITIAVIAGMVIFADQAKAKNVSAAVATTPNTSTVASDDTSASEETTTATTVANPTPTPTVTTPTSGIKDGTYTASSNYYVPPGQERIAVNLTLKNGVITDVSITNSESDRDSAYYQQEFTANYKARVVGQKITGLQIITVAGASDTTQGFNDALSQIASKAQA